MSNIFTIYKIINKINGKVYIGYTSFSAKHRFTQHIKDSSRKILNQPIHKAINKYGPDNFSIEEVCQSLDEDYSFNVLEPYFIQEYKKEGQVYNIHPGGRGYKSNPHKKQVEVYDKKLQLINTFDSVKNAANFLGVHSATVSGTCRCAEKNRASQIKGFYVCYKGGTPKKKDTTYLSELNKIRKPMLGKTRPEHSRLMKEHPPRLDNKIYTFIHTNGMKFKGTRLALSRKYPKHNISSQQIGVMIRGYQKSHKGWKLFPDSIIEDPTM